MPDCREASLKNRLPFNNFYKELFWECKSRGNGWNKKEKIGRLNQAVCWFDEDIYFDSMAKQFVLVKLMRTDKQQQGISC
jgi:hypothetical protein